MINGHVEGDIFLVREVGSLVLGNRQTEILGSLRISLPPNLSENLIMPVACTFQNASTKVCIKTLVTERYVDLTENAVDIDFRVGKLESSSLIARRLLIYRHLLVASPSYIEKHGEPCHPNDLDTHQLITFGGWQKPSLWELESDGELNKTVINPTLSINEMSGNQYAAEAGLGIAVLQELICGKALQDSRLVEVMPLWRFLPTKLSALYPSNRNASRLVKLFLDFCVTHIEQHIPK